MDYSDLVIFEKDTDAIATNKGFYYQYLHTLKNWLEYYLNNENIKIYCETEDDIKSLNKDTSDIVFRQIKCYSKSFSFSSEEIKKSFYNTFFLYKKYKDCCTTFYFETNSSISPKDALLSKWHKNQSLISDELLEEISNKVKEVLIPLFEEEKLKNEKLLNKKINTLINKPAFKNLAKEAQRMASISDLNKDKDELLITFNGVKKLLLEECSDFASCIKWKFQSKKPDDAIKSIEGDIFTLIKSIPSLKHAEHLIFARLLSDVYKKSCEDVIENRVLDSTLLKKIILESKEEIERNITIQLNPILSEGFRNMEAKLDGIEKLIKPTSPASIPFPFYEDGEIDNQIKKEGEKESEKARQSNLERKIKEIQFEISQDESSAIKIATSFRCSYLIYLEELKLSKLDEEYKILKSLELKVRNECTKSMSMIFTKTTFNSNEFWNEFQSHLEELVESHNSVNKIKVDTSFVFGQMYQVAAECSLRWNKVK